MQALLEIPEQTLPQDQDIAYFEAKIRDSGKPRNDPSNARYVQIIEQLKATQRQVLLG